jgi:hypothetical protein
MGLGVAVPLVIGYFVVGRRKLRDQRRRLDAVDASSLSAEDRALHEAYHAQVNGRRPKRLRSPQLEDLARWDQTEAAPQTTTDGGMT